MDNKYILNIIELYKTNKKKVKFLFIGGTTFIINYLILIFTKEVFKFSENISVTLAFFIGVFYHFSMNKIFVFKAMNFNNLFHEVSKYVILTIINYLINIGTVNLFMLFSISSYVSVPIAILITLFLTYFVMNKIIFKKTVDKTE